MKVFIIVLNWNKPQDTIECVRSCHGQGEIIILDNASSDNSVLLLRKTFPKLKIIQNSDNLGYVGNNVGIRYALKQGADAVFLLNNDTVINPDCVKELSIASRIMNAGILAPKVLKYNTNVIESTGTYIDWLRLRPLESDFGKIDVTEHDTLTDFLTRDILVGCALFIKREVFDCMGAFDDKFFIFHEDADLCLRSLDRGFVNLTISKAIVYHKGSETMKDFTALTHYYSTRNFLYLARKHANALDSFKVALGLIYYSFKHLFAKPDIRRAFFCGVWDFHIGRMGQCKRQF